MTPERSRLWAELEQITGLSSKPARSKPKVVVKDDKPVADADVVVSPADPNAASARDGVVRVRRPDVVTINYDEAERRFAQREAAAEARACHDPYRLGLWD